MKARCIFSLLILLSLIGIGSNVVAKTIYVNETGWWESSSDFYPSSKPIQSAVDSSTTHDVIRIFNGSYSGTTTIQNKINITLVGNSSEGTVVNTGSSDGIKVINSAWIKIKNLRLIRNAAHNSNKGVYNSNSNFCEFENIVTNNFRQGFVLDNSENVEVKNCFSRCYKYSYTIYKAYNVYGEGNNTLVDNIGKNCDYGFDIKTGKNVLTGNTAENNDDYGFQVAANNKLYDNSAISGNKYGFYINGNNILENNTAKGNIDGFFSDGDNCFLKNNSALGNSGNGFSVRDGNLVIANRAENSGGRGFDIYGNNNILKNNIAKGTENGFVVGGNDINNTFINNTAAYNANNGFYIWGKDCLLDNNIIESNVWYGISLVGASNITIVHNTIKDNGNYGIKLSGATNNTVYNNYFDNFINFYISADSAFNTFNTTLSAGENIIGGNLIGGNYWSDYSGLDENNDGIGDTPYNIGSNHTDHYPLTYGISPCEYYDTNGNDVIGIDEAVQAVIDYFDNKINRETAIAVIICYFDSCKSNDDCYYTEYCKKDLGDCNGFGKCEVLPEGCTDEWMPVCGCDGQTYSNYCYAGRDGVNVAYEGECT